MNNKNVNPKVVGCFIGILTLIAFAIVIAFWL